MRGHRHSHSQRHDANAILTGLIERTKAGQVRWASSMTRDDITPHYTAQYEGARLKACFGMFRKWLAVTDGAGKSMTVPIGQRLAWRLHRAIHVERRARFNRAADAVLDASLGGNVFWTHRAPDKQWSASHGGYRWVMSRDGVGVWWLRMVEGNDYHPAGSLRKARQVGMQLKALRALELTRIKELPAPPVQATPPAVVPAPSEHHAVVLDSLTQAAVQ